MCENCPCKLSAIISINDNSASQNSMTSIVNYMSIAEKNLDKAK